MSDSPHYRYLAINGQFLPEKFLDSVWEHLNQLTPLLEAEIIQPSPADKLAYLVLKQITLRMTKP